MLLTRTRSGFVLPDLSFFPFVEPMIRIEDFHDDDRYIVRAEIPGVDVAKDVDITAKDGYLYLAVVRLEETKEQGHSEFRYGTFHRTVTLPPGTREDTISANYTDGILEITMKVGEPIETGKHIPIAIGNGINAGHVKEPKKA
jgi:HSP20 family protein